MNVRPTRLTRLTRRATLSPPTPADALSHTSVGPDGLPVAIWRGAGGVTLTAHGADGQVTAGTALGDPGLSWPDLLQPLPGGSWLLAESRCGWSAVDGAARNGRVFGADGTLLAEECLGDGIVQLAATASGLVWAGHDESGIDGLRREGPVGPVGAVGAAGLVAWDATLTRVFEHDGRRGAVRDVWCLNATADGDMLAWVTGDVALVGVTAQFGESAHPLPAGLAPDGDPVVALLTDGDLVALVRVRAGSPGSAASRTVVDVAGPLPGWQGPVERYELDVDWNEVTAWVGRGPVLHVFEGPRWSTLDLAGLGRGTA